MNQAETLAKEPRGNADVAAKDILDAYFEENPERDEDGGQESAEPGPETVASGEPEDSEPETAAPSDDSGEEEEYTVAELAEHFQVDPEALYAARISMEDGTKIPISRMKDEWTAARRQLAEIDSAREEIEQARNYLQSQAAQIQSQQGLLGIAPDQEEQNLVAELMAYNRAEADQEYWRQAEQNDRAGAALAMQKLSAKKQQLQQAIMGKQQARAQQAQAQMQQLGNAAWGEIVGRIPEWRDNRQAETDWKTMRDIMIRFGGTPQQVDQMVYTPWAMHMTKTFLDLLRAKAAANPEAKKVIPIRGLRSGARSGEEAVTKTKFAKIAQRAKGGDRKAQAVAAKHLLKDFL